MGKLSTPDWIREGFDSKADWEKHSQVRSGSSKSQTKAHGKKGPRTPAGSKGKTYKVKTCPKCGSSEVRVVLGGEEGRGSRGWECLSCKWQGKEVDEKEMNEDEFLGHLKKMGGK